MPGEDPAAAQLAQRQRAGVAVHQPRQLAQHLLDGLLQPGRAGDGLENLAQGLGLHAPLALALDGVARAHAQVLAVQCLAHGLHGLLAALQAQLLEPARDLGQDPFQLDLPLRSW